MSKWRSRMLDVDGREVHSEAARLERATAAAASAGAARAHLRVGSRADGLAPPFRIPCYAGRKT